MGSTSVVFHVGGCVFGYTLILGLSRLASDKTSCWIDESLDLQIRQAGERQDELTG